MKTRWTTKDIPDLGSKTVIVTGANSGLGYETALALAAAGAHVVMACRNRDKAEAAIRQIQIAAPQAKLKFLPLDLGDLSSIRTFTELFAADHSALDLLCNNAGVLAAP